MPFCVDSCRKNDVHAKNGNAFRHSYHRQKKRILHGYASSVELAAVLCYNAGVTRGGNPHGICIERKYIRSLRKARSLTQEQLAETPGAVYKWESRLSLPELPMLIQLADFLIRRWMR